MEQKNGAERVCKVFLKPQHGRVIPVSESDIDTTGKAQRPSGAGVRARMVIGDLHGAVTEDQVGHYTSQSPVSMERHPSTRRHTHAPSMPHLCPT